MSPDEGKQGHCRRLLWTQFQLPKIYQKFGSSLLFSPIPEAPLWRNCRYVVTVHDLIGLRFPQHFSPLTLYNRYYIPQVLWQAQHIICVSMSTAQDIHRFWEIPIHKITPIPLAHDADHFRYLNLPTKNYFLYVGRIDPYKNLHRLVTAFAALSNRSELELWIAGPIDSRYLPALITQIEELRLDHHIKFLNYVPYQQLPILFNQAIGLVFPSLWEGFGLPVLEAMACGTPVITSNLASLPEVTGDAALLVDPYDVRTITQAMQALAADCKLRCQLRTEGLKRASQFSWQKTGQSTIEVLKQYL